MRQKATQAICEQENTTGALERANLVSPCCVWQGEHVERLATVSHVIMRLVFHPHLQSDLVTHW
jgi:hypothetical protein